MTRPRRLLKFGLILAAGLLAACQPPTLTEAPRNPPTLTAPPAAAVGESAVTAANLARLAYIRQLAGPENEPTSTLFSFALSNDGTALAALNEALLLVWELESGQRRITTSRLDVVRIYFSADGVQLFGLTNSGAIVVFDSTTGAGLARFQGIDNYSGVAAYDAERGLLALGSLDGKVKIWQPSTGTALATLTASAAPITGLALSADGESAFMGTEASFKRITWGDRALAAEQRVARAESLYNMVVSSDGRWAAASTDFNVVLWNVAAPDEMIALDAGSGGANQLLSFSPDGRYLVASSRVSGMTVWDIAGGDAMARLPIAPGSTASAAFAPGGPLLITAGLESGVNAWDLAALRGSQINQAALPVGTGSIHQAAWTPDGRRLLLFDTAGAVYVWAVPSG